MDSEIVAALGASLLTGGFLVTQGCLTRKWAREDRLDDRHERRRERAEDAAVALADAVDELKEACDRLVASTPVDRSDSGASPFAPEIKAIDPELFTNVSRAFHRVRIYGHTGDANLGSQFLAAAHRVDLMAQGIWVKMGTYMEPTVFAAQGEMQELERAGDGLVASVQEGLKALR